MSLPIALQLYTIRDFLKDDFEGALRQVAEIGYRHVELAGLYGRTPEQAKAILDRLGLTAIASHDGLPVLADDLDAAIHQARTFGYDLIVCPWLDEKHRTAEGFERTLRMLTDANAKARDHGITICYHNHAFEFETLPDGRRGIDILFDGTDLASELDVYWVQKGGDDPLDWLEKLSGRLPLLHLKDMADTDEGGFTEIGRGTVDIPALVRAAPKHGVRYLVVEQDSNWTDTAMESSRVGYQNLATMVA